MTTQHVEEFDTFLRSLGIHPKGIYPNGKVVRTTSDFKPKKKSAAYLLRAEGTSGWAQIWGLHDAVVSWSTSRGSQEYKPDPNAARKRREAWIASERSRREASAAARRFLHECSPLIGGHPYLAKKGLSMLGCHQLALSKKGDLVVPMTWMNQVISVQRISANGDKLFFPGARSSKVVFKINRRLASTTILCEGLATGLALFQSVPDARVVVAFTAGNLVNIAEAMRGKVSGRVVIAADNDHRTVCPTHKTTGFTTACGFGEERPDWCRCNPGMIQAIAAGEILGCVIAHPEGIEGTDWADYLQERVAYLTREVYMQRPMKTTAARRLAASEVERSILSKARYL